MQKWLALVAIASCACSNASSPAGVDGGADSSVAHDVDVPVDALSLFGGLAKFTDVAASAGLPDVGGPCLVFDDFDGDARPDVFSASFFGASPVVVDLYVNDGKGHFTRKPLPPITFPGKAPSPGWCAAGDVDGDGKLDVVLASFDGFEAHVLHNLGGAAFADVQTLATDATNATGNSAAALADFDGDGLLDFVVAPYGFAPSLDHSSCNVAADGFACVAPGDRCLRPPLVFRNTGTATPFAGGAPIGSPTDCGPANANALSVVDWNDDGHADLFVSNDWGRNYFYVNSSGALSDVFPTLGAKSYNSAMGAAFEDFDFDGKLDLYVADMGSDQFYPSAAGGPLVEHASDWGVAAPTRLHSGWAPLAEDFDDDGFPDVFVASAAFVTSYDELASVGGRGQTAKRINYDLLLHSDAGHSFSALGVPQTKIAEPTPEFGATAVADFDGDGKLDVLEAIGYPMRLQLLHNETPSQHWIDVRLKGKAPNVDGIGATVTLGMPGKPAWKRYVTRSRGTNGNSSATQHFGLGASTTIDRIEVRWPGGATQTITAPKADAVLVVTQA